MQQYTSNRIREAFKITRISRGTIGTSGEIINLIGENDDVIVSEEYMDKHKPKEGWYYVRYPDDGYQSACPGDVFEKGSTPKIVTSPQGDSIDII